MDKIDIYLEQLYLTEQIELLDEGVLKDIVKKLVPESKIKSVISKLKKSFDIKKPEKIIKAAKGIKIPAVNPKIIDKTIGSKVPLFRKNKAIAKPILKNSLPKAKDKSIEAAATFVALQSLFKKKGETENLKAILRKNIKDFVLRARKFESDYESQPEEKQTIPADVLGDYIIGSVIIILALVTMGYLMSGVYAIVSLIVGIFSGLLPQLAIAALAGIIFYCILVEIGDVKPPLGDD